MTSADGVIYTWDANRNMTGDGVSTYAYNVENRLTSITTGSEMTGFIDNGLGNRLSHTIGLVTTNFMLDLNAGLILFIRSTWYNASA
jgi:hypothetical protein